MVLRRPTAQWSAALFTRPAAHRFLVRRGVLGTPSVQVTSTPCAPRRLAHVDAWSGASASSPTLSSSTADGAVLWVETLRGVLDSSTAHAESPQPPVSASTVARIADACLQTEGRRVYAVYRPCASPSHGGAASPSRLPTPGDYLLLLRVLPSLGLADVYGPRIARILVELLRKPLHPQHGVLGSWDLGQEEMEALVGEVLRLVSTALPGPAALAWIDDLFACRRAQPSAHQPAPLVCEALRERLARYSGTATHLSATVTFTPQVVVGAPGGEALLCTPYVVACVAAALIRSEAVAAKHEAMTILELAASARFATDAHHSARGPPSQALFSEEVAVECAEAAAVVGDSETVARLTFLLYRCRGALGVATLSERTAQTRQHVRAGSHRPAASPGLWGHLLAPLASSVPAAWRRVWGDSAAKEAAPAWEADTDSEDDVRFERAAVRMLKTVIRAALRHPAGSPGTAAVGAGGAAPRPGDDEPAELKEALALFEALRTGTSWAGTAAMVVELLTYLASTAQQRDAVALTAAAHLENQRKALYLLSVLLRGAGSTTRQSEGQQRILAVCVRRVLEVIVARSKTDRATPTLHTSHTSDALQQIPSVSADHAPLVLGLFGLVDVAQQAPLLPYALAATVALLASPTSCAATWYRELDSPSLHTAVRRLLLQDVHSQLPVLLAPVNAFFADTPLSRTHVYTSASSPSPPCGALLLILSLLLRCHEKGASALTEREALAALAPLSTHFSECWRQADAGPRRLVWQWLLHPPVPPRPLVGSGGSALVDAVATLVTNDDNDAALSAHETRQVVRSLYTYGDSRARTLVDTLLTRHFGFTVLTRATSEVVQEVTPRGALVLVGASTIHARSHAQFADGQGVCGDDVARLHTFLRHVVESNSVPARSRSATTTATPVTVVLTLNGLLALPTTAMPSGGTDRETRVKDGDALVPPVAAALSYQLRGLAPPSSTEAVAPVALEVVVLAPLDDGRGRPSSQSLPASLSVPVPSLDGSAECTALAKELARRLPVEQRPPLFFWCEESPGREAVGRPAFASRTAAEEGDDEDGLERWLSRHRIRLVSARRILVERAKRDVISLLRPDAQRGLPLSVSLKRGGATPPASESATAKVLTSDILRPHRFSK